MTLLQVTGSITYNGKGFDQFKAAHTAAYVDQNDLHQPELTVRETFDFAARCQGTGNKTGMFSSVSFCGDLPTIPPLCQGVALVSLGLSQVIPANFIRIKSFKR